MTKFKIKYVVLWLLVAISSITALGCNSFFGQGSSVTRYTESMESATGKWMLLGQENTYFAFDGTKGAMTFNYYEDGNLKHSGNFRSVYNSSSDARTPLTFIITRSDKAKEDWINCYVENFAESFTQFSIMCEEEDQGYIDGTVYTHVYRISEMPYKIGTYVLEGKEYAPFSKTGFEKEYYIPEGTYISDGGQSLMVFPIMNWGYSLFTYTNKEIVVEGIFNIAEDRNTIYLYIEHDIYQKIKNSDKDNYDKTFSLYYPPDFYLRGDFDTNDNSLIINELYHHPYSPTKIEDSTWAFGTYVKQ